MGKVIEVPNWDQVKRKRQEQKERDQALRSLLMAAAKLKW